MNAEKPCVALCMPVQTMIHPLTERSYRALRRGSVDWQHFDCVGQPVDLARNLITKQALADPKVTHLLWIDSDMVYPAEALEQLLAHNVPFVGGLCFDRRHPFKPVIGRKMHPSWGYDDGTIGWLFDYPENELIDVDWTGGAFLLIERKVFERIRDLEAPEGKRDEYMGWWKPTVAGIAEDLSFCDRARAAGFRITVDTGLKIGHVGEVVIDEAFVKRNRAFYYSRWLPSLESLAQALATTGPCTEELMDAEQPIASIVITAFNPNLQHFKAAVLSALAQTVKCEVIVVDDGSSVPVQNILDAYGLDGKVRVLRHETNRGIAAALNTGVEAMSTKWFCWLPCDDMFDPTKVELQLAALLSAEEKCGYHGYTLKPDNKNGIAHRPVFVAKSWGEQQEALGANCYINGTTVMIHRSVLEQVGPFDASFRYAQDWEMWCRIGRAGFRWHGMPDQLATRREFGNLTERLKKLDPQDPARRRRDMEDGRVRRMYATALCPECGEVLP